MASSVTVQMTDDPDELDALLAAAQPRNPRPDPDPDAPTHRQPGSPDPADPADPRQNPTPQERHPLKRDEEPTDEEAGDTWEDRPADPPAGAGAKQVPTGTLDQPVSEMTELTPHVSESPASRLIEGEIIPVQKRYVSRITIVDAWQYPGTLSSAPTWIDRNWAAYADDYDQIRELEPGPALRVPTHGEGYRTTLCRIGDFVARQEVKLLANVPGEIKIEVWEKEQFERLFIPTQTEKVHVEAHAA